MPLTRSSSLVANTDVELGRDVPDARLVLTVDSVGRQFTGESPVPIHSCVNIAVQTDEDNSSCWNCVGFMKKALIQKLALVAVGVLVVVIIIMIERFAGIDIIDEKKLVQDIAAEVLPQIMSGRANATSPPQ